jgi:hypothetical protein
VTIADAQQAARKPSSSRCHRELDEDRLAPELRRVLAVCMANFTVVLFELMGLGGLLVRRE